MISRSEKPRTVRRSAGSWPNALSLLSGPPCKSARASSGTDTVPGNRLDNLRIYCRRYDRHIYGILHLHLLQLTTLLLFTPLPAPEGFSMRAFPPVFARVNTKTGELS